MSRYRTATFKKSYATPHLRVTEPDNAWFVIYCRKCHQGLCSNMDIGEVGVEAKTINVILVEPCKCEERGTIHAQYLPALEE